MAEWNPFIVNSRPMLHDLSITDLQKARDSGIALQQANRASESAALGISTDAQIQLIEAIKKNTDIELSLKILGLGFHGELIPLTAAVPQLVIRPQKTPRGYIIINPAEVSGFSSTVTFFPSLLRAPATYNSASFNVSGVETVRQFLDVTVQAAGATLVVNAQTQDPLTGNWVTSQADIFGSNAAVGTYYADVGALGVDQSYRLQAVVGVNNETFSISGLMKGGALLPVGQTVYLGASQDVNSLTGYPMLPAQREYFFLLDDVPLYAITPTNPMQLKVFYLQG
jgi:hypothetical protein